MMFSKIVTILLLPMMIFASAKELYDRALFQEEVKGNFEKAKVLYKKIVSEYTKEQVFVGRSLYHLGNIYKLQGDSNSSKTYYTMVANSYKNLKGLSKLAELKLKNTNKAMYTQVSASKINTAQKIKKQEIKKTAPIQKITKLNEKKSKYYNDKYKTGKTSELYLMNLGEERTLNFTEGIKSLGISDPKLLKLNPSTSKIVFKAQKIGECEMSVIDKNNKKHTITVIVINPNNLNINIKYLVKGESRKINLENLKQIELDNDNLKISAKRGQLNIDAMREGDVVLAVQRTDGTTLKLKLIVYKKYTLNKNLTLNSGAIKILNEKNIVTMLLNNKGIVDVNISSDNITIKAIKKGKVELTLNLKEGVIKYNIEVK